MKKLFAYDSEKPSRAVMRVNLFTSLVLIVFGLFVEGNPIQSLKGVWTIFASEGSLITDYIITAGIGGAFLNAGLAMLLAVITIRLSGATFGGASLGCCYIVAGFALFGKNVFNMIPIITGTWIYAKVVKEPFSKHVLTALFATCAGPVVQYCMFHNPLIDSMAINVVLGIILSMLIGFVVPPVAGIAARTHDGMLIYNVGFAAGFVCIVLVSILKGIGFEFAGRSSWCDQYNQMLTVFLVVLFGSHILLGFLLNDCSFKGLLNLPKHSGQLPCDYVALEGLPITLVNMGILGLMSTFYVLAVGGDLSGPILAAILSVGGFGGLGKNYYNVIWAVLGIVILSFLPSSVWALNEPVALLGALFSTCICSFAGKYGPVYGIIAGMLHISVVRNTASMYGWINLYNNGFAAGLVCMIWLPIVQIVQNVLKRPKKSELNLK